MKRKILVFGGVGMVGQAVIHCLRQQGDIEVGATYHSTAPLKSDGFVRCDVTASDGSLVEVLRGVHTVVNCAVVLAGAMRQLSDAALRQTLQVNSVFPKRLAQVAAREGVRVIHLSSDGVFSGEGGAPYSEDSLPDARDWYGVSKLLGEECAPNVINIRTSIVGIDRTYHRGLLEWVLTHPAGATLHGYENHLWQGVTAKQLAEGVSRLLDPLVFDEVRNEGSVHHLCPNDVVSKFHLVECIAQLSGKNLQVKREFAPDGGVDRRLVTKRNSSSLWFPLGGGIESALRELME